MRLVAYVRVSTIGQVTEGAGLEDQERVIRAWARVQGHRVIAACRDEAVSGTKELDDRLGLVAALAAVKEGRAEGIVVYRLDRLARDMVLQEQLMAEVWRHGEILSTAGGEQHLRDDPEDPSRRMIRQILGVVAEYERNMIVLRLRRGRASKASRGGFAYGSPPLGLRHQDKALVRDDAEAPTVDLILRLHRGGRSYRQIAAELQAAGHKTKRGGQWWPGTVRRIVLRGAPR